jgi:hypothetical protein
MFHSVVVLYLLMRMLTITCTDVQSFIGTFRSLMLFIALWCSFICNTKFINQYQSVVQLILVGSCGNIMLIAWVCLQLVFINSCCKLY